MRAFLVSSAVFGLALAGCGGSEARTTRVVDAGPDTGSGMSESGGTGGKGGATGTGGSVSDGGKGGSAAPDSGAGGGSSGPDASVEGGSPDASLPDGGATCDFGSAGSFATQAELNLFGEIVYFQDGDVLPAGRYRLTYQDGCMKYAGDQAWTIHAYADGAQAAWWIVGDSSATRVTVPPGTVGYYTSNGAFDTFEECVAANGALPPTEFDFAGGKLGVWLMDSNYGDNLAGVDGRNPRWQLTLLGACVGGDH